MCKLTLSHPHVVPDPLDSLALVEPKIHWKK